MLGGIEGHPWIKNKQCQPLVDCHCWLTMEINTLKGGLAYYRMHILRADQANFTRSSQIAWHAAPRWPTCCRRTGRLGNLFVCVHLRLLRCTQDDSTLEDWWHRNNILQVGLPSCARYGSKSRANLKIAKTKSVFIVQRENNYAIIWGFCFGSTDRQRSNIKTIFRMFENPCFAHDSFNLTSYKKDGIMCIIN